MWLAPAATGMTWQVTEEVVYAAIVLNVSQSVISAFHHSWSNGVCWIYRHSSLIG